jgi:hypothetical protein
MLTRSHLCPNKFPATEELDTDYYWASRVVQIAKMVNKNIGTTVMSNFESGTLDPSWLIRGHVAHGGE